MTDSEILEKYQQPFPVSFKVIGTGTGATDIIEKVKSFGYECVGCILAETPSDCIPIDDDKMVIIVARDNEEVANAIAGMVGIFYWKLEEIIIILQAQKQKG